MDAIAIYELLLEKLKNSNGYDYAEEMIDYIEHELLLRSQITRKRKEQSDNI